MRGYRRTGRQMRIRLSAPSSSRDDQTQRTSTSVNTAHLALVILVRQRVAAGRHARLSEQERHPLEACDGSRRGCAICSELRLTGSSREAGHGDGPVHCAPHNACRPQREEAVSAQGSQRAFITLRERALPCKRRHHGRERRGSSGRPILSKSPGLAQRPACLPARVGWVGRINLCSRLTLAIGRSRCGRPPYGLLTASS